MSPRALGFGAVSIAVILAATLLPDIRSAVTGRAVCGDWGADALLNVALFLPFGAAVAALFPRRREVLVRAAGFAAAIEVVQVLVPGRHPSLIDVVTNVVGAALGAALARAAPGWMRPAPARAGRWGAAAATAVAGVLAASGWLLQPSFPRSSWFGQWAIELEAYGWRVLDARIGDLWLPSWRLDDPALAHQRLAARDTLRVRAVAGRAAPRVAALFTIADEAQRGILFLGADSADLMIVYRTRAAAVHLEQPGLWLRGAMAAFAPSDTVEIAMSGTARGYCVIVGGRPTCGLGHTLASGWSLLFCGEGVPAWLTRLSGLAWIAGLFAAAGFWLRRPRALTWALIPGAALAVVPPAAGLLATPAPAWLAAGVGLAAGAALGRLAGRRVAG